MLEKLADKLKNIDIKHLVKVLAIFFGFVLIIVMSIVNVGINKEFDVVEWLKNSIIILGIIVFGLLMGETSGRDKQIEKVNGLYQTSLRNYNEFFKKIEGKIIYFAQFYSWLLPKQLREKKINFLIKNNVDPAKANLIVDNCSKQDIEELKLHPIERNGIIIRQLEEHEVDAVLEIFDKSFKLNVCNANYYLTAFSEGDVSSTILEEGKDLEGKRKNNRHRRRILKMVSSLVFSLIFGLLTANELMKAGDTQAWFNLIMRITALLTSLFSGWLSSVVDVKLMARMLINKLNVLKLFENCMKDKVFIPKFEQDLAKEEYEKWQKEELEKQSGYEIVEEPKPLEITTGGIEYAKQ